MSGSAERRKVKLISRKIIFEEVQRMWTQSTNVTDKRTTYHGSTALRYASRGKNCPSIIYTSLKVPLCQKQPPSVLKVSKCCAFR